jgi:hypothetical protein
MKISKETQIEYTITMSEEDALTILNGLGRLDYHELARLSDNLKFGSVMNNLYETLVSKIKRGSILKDN